MNTKSKNRARLTLVITLFFAFVVLAIASVGVFRYANAQVSVQQSEEIQSEYAFGDEFTLPVCVFEKGGNRVDASASLEFPDGSQTSEEKVTLNQSGKYVLRYFASMEGKVYTKEYAFSVYGRLAAYKSEKTSVEYGKITHLGANSTGLTLRIANGDAITFDHVFDMTKMTVSTQILEGFVLPNAHGAADFSKMIFTFTDVEDPSVQLVYHGNFHNDSRAYGLSYFTAAGNGQVQTGLEYVGKLHVGGTLGCVVPHSFMAMDTGLFWGHRAPTPVAPDEKTFRISYDDKNKQAWAGGKIISDLDDGNYYDKLWFGFPSGKAKLSISASGYNDVTANICITKILGVDLSAKNYVDEVAPIITIDNRYEKMPNAVVGGSYPVPTASAIDQVSGESNVRVSVWHNYGMDGAKMVDVTDGRFAVNHVGMYAIVYEAADFSGNVEREVLWVRAYLPDDLQALSVTIQEDYVAEMEVGVLQTIPTVNYVGGCGDVQITYELTKGRVTTPILNGVFRLEEAGEWTLTCTATDYVGNIAVDICVLQAKISGKPILMDEPQFPVAYISGSSYELPKLYAYDYSMGQKEEKLCDVLVECEGQSPQNYVAGDLFVPMATENDGLVKLTYSCKGEKLLQKEIPVIIVISKEVNPNTGRPRSVLSAEKYFYTEDDLSLTNHFAISEYSGLKISANTDMDSAKLSFINPQMASNFSLDFLTIPGAAKFTQFNLILRDSLDASVQIKATLSKGDGETLLTVGGAELALDFDFDGGANAAFNLGFADKSFIVNGTTHLALKNEDGSEFQGFPSGKMYFEIELDNVEAGAAIFISKICSISISNKQDSIGPFISTKENITTSAFKDSVYRVQKVVAGDVFCPNAEAYLTVIGANGKPVTSVDGILLQEVDATRDYDILLTDYGEYYVTIVAKEADTWISSIAANLEYSIVVVDGEKPTISFKDSFEKTLKVGELLVIPKFTVSDNFSKAEDISVIKMIINPNGMPIMLFDDVNAVRCEYVGTYTVIIYVCDKAGNLTTYETKVNVK